MPVVLLFNLWQSCPVIGVRIRDVLIACLPGLGAAAAMAALVWMMRIGLAGTLDSGLPRSWPGWRCSRPSAR